MQVLKHSGFNPEDTVLRARGIESYSLVSSLICSHANLIPAWKYLENDREDLCIRFANYLA